MRPVTLFRLLALQALLHGLRSAPAYAQTAPALLPGALTHAQAAPASLRDAAVDQHYEITVSLDAARHVVSGHASIRFTNHSPIALHELYFHLYPNAFAGPRTVFMREGGADLRETPLGRPGRLDVRSLRDAHGNDLLAHANPELIVGDRTQLRVPLDTPLPPSTTLTLEVEFTTQLPSLVARSGFAGEFHMLGQWFPKLAKLEADGSWASFPYHGLGEFYADFADYTLHITLPDRFVTGGSGVRVASERRAGLRTEHWRAQSVHDFAWVAYPYFETYDVDASGTTVHVLAPRGYATQAKRQARLVGEALDYFGRMLGRYPYPALTVVIPPPNAHAAYAMEYPTLFVSAGGMWAPPYAWPDPVTDAIVAHELAHQWFCGMLASNEVQAPMLDEGLAEWAALDFLRSHYRQDTQLLHHLARRVDVFDVARVLFLRSRTAVPSSLEPAYRYRIHELNAAVYLRPALVLDGVEHDFGRAALLRVLGQYTRQQRFKHPDIDTFFATFDAVLSPGYGTQVLRAELSGQASHAAQATAQATLAPRAQTWVVDAWFALVAVFSWLGP